MLQIFGFIWSDFAVGNWELLLMAEIWLTSWDVWNPINNWKTTNLNWCRISAINSMTFLLVFCSVNMRSTTRISTVRFLPRSAPAKPCQLCNAHVSLGQLPENSAHLTRKNNHRTAYICLLCWQLAKLTFCSMSSMLCLESLCALRDSSAINNYLRMLSPVLLREYIVTSRLEMNKFLGHKLPTPQSFPIW